MRASEILGNPGAIHAEGVVAAKALEESREKIAREFGCKTREIIFTSGGTEANNLAIIGIAERRTRDGKSLEGTHWVVSAIEHPSVLECFAEIERAGGSVSHVDPDARGVILPEVVTNTLRPETVCVSIGWSNSEIGVLQPLSDIARAIRAYEGEHGAKILFHSDAGQAPVYRATVIHTLGVDMLTLDSAKLYGPRGVGALYIGGRAEIAPILRGGNQERGLRPGTENIALAAGFAEALEGISEMRDAESSRLASLRDGFAADIHKAVPGAVENGERKHLLPHMFNISIPNIQSEYLTLALDHAGIAISTKSACREGEERRSHVVEALAAASEALAKEAGQSWRAANTLRFSLGTGSTARELGKTAKILAALVNKKQQIGLK